MKHNVGGIDRMIRLLIGLGLIGWGLAVHNWWGTIGVIPLLTAVFGRCPAYLPLGISTCSTKEEKEA